MPHESTTVIVVVALALLVGALVQGVVGVGLGLVSAPVITLADPALMPTLPLVLAALLPLVTLVSEHDDIDWRGLSWSVPPRVLGTGVGVLAVATFDPTQLGVAVALMVLVAVALTVRAVVLPLRPGTLMAAGLVSGVTGTATSIGGPPMALLYQHEPPTRVRTTLAVYFSSGATLSLVGLALAGELDRQVALLALALTPCLVVGAVAAQVVKGWLGGRSIRPAVLTVCAASAIVLLVRSLAA